jgi:hypothetical protein
MADVGIGNLIYGSQERDAIHVAVTPAIAAENLQPGQHVGFVKEDDTKTVGTKSTNLIGIVDPFLKHQVEEGDQFWMFLYPNSVTSLRHNWSHPAFVAARSSVTKVEAEKWMREFADRADITYRQAIEAGREFNEYGEYFVQHGQENARDEIYRPGIKVQYWRNWEIITGEKVKDPDGEVFSCSC